MPKEYLSEALGYDHISDFKSTVPVTIKASRRACGGGRLAVAPYAATGCVAKVGRWIAAGTVIVTGMESLKAGGGCCAVAIDTCVCNCVSKFSKHNCGNNIAGRGADFP